MRKLLYLILFMPLFLLAGCDVHEWPETPEYVRFHLRLNYETDMTEWHHLYDGSSVVEVRYGDTYDNHQEYGQIRYIVRAYPMDGQRATQDYRHEFVFTKNVAEGYDHEVTLDLLSGNYQIMVWSDLVTNSSRTPFYDAANFAEIHLQGEHKPNTDHRDAFRGTNSISLIADIMEHIPDTLDIAMQRPLAKYEFITTDVVEFIEKEYTRVASKAASGNNGTTAIDPSSRVINIEDYKVMFYYVGFMPDAYSIYTDKPVDSSTGVFFESTLKKLNESEASVGFDYVLVNGKKSVVTVQIGIFDKEGEQLSMSDPIDVPLQRDHHTIIRGMFLMSEASGGVFINPEFDGDYNLIFPY